jgi:hypothetical protein
MNQTAELIGKINQKTIKAYLIKRIEKLSVGIDKMMS